MTTLELIVAHVVMGAIAAAAFFVLCNVVLVIA